MEQVLPQVPHQVCQYHYLKEAAKTKLKKYVKGVREIERSVATREDEEAIALARRLQRWVDRLPFPYARGSISRPIM